MAEEYGNGSIAPPHTKGGVARVAPLPQRPKPRPSFPHSRSRESGKLGQGRSAGASPSLVTPTPPTIVIPAEAGIQRGGGVRSP